MPEFRVDDEAGKLKWLIEDARRPVQYFDGDRAVHVDVRPVVRGPLKKVAIHPYYDGPVEVNWASELAVRTVRLELGREPVSDDEYLEVLTAVGNEKGWTVTF